MKTRLNFQLQLKSGEIMPVGRECSIEPIKNNDGGCRLVFGPEQTDVLPYSTMPYFFEEFEMVTMDMLEDAALDSVCVSVRGEEVEPDGYDSQGFPSILLAAGLI